jgi:crotonobetainyl-CoA:carnitine CoA-transferase CaiB-like acyl-CoA transferase
MLDDVLVIELGTCASTGYAGKMLRDVGATVVRVERRDAPAPQAGDVDYLTFLHGGKGSVAPTSWSGLAAEFPDLVARADAVICDHPQHVDLANQLRASRPDLVVVSISDYGTVRPGLTPPANEFTLQAESGLTAIHPTGSRPPVRAGVDLGEFCAGTNAAIGVVAGLLSVETGAERVDASVSRLESLIASLQFPWVFAQHDHHAPYTVPAAAVPGIEQAQDGWVCVVCVTPQQWTDFKIMAGIPQLDDPRYDQLVDRQDLTHELTPLIRQFTSRYTVQELMEMGAAARVPIVPVATSADVVNLPPYAERGSFVPHPDGFIQPRPAFHIDGANWAPGSRPEPGRDNSRPWGDRRARSVRTPAVGGRPLSGLRVVELGTFQAGPLVTRALAGLGADVIKVESINRPDLLRFGGPWGTIPDAWERGASFTGTNWGKRSLTADLKDPDGLEIVRRLIASSHLVVENFSPRVLDSVGLDADGMHRIRDDVVVLRMPAWGMSGAWRDWPGFTYSANAASGLSDLTGYPDGDPLLTGTAIDPIAADISTFIALAALRHLLRTGRGASIEVPLCDVAAQLTAAAVIESSRTGTKAQRRGNDSDRAVPQGMFSSLDGRWVAVSVTTDKQWFALASVIESDGGTVPDSNATLDRRIENRDAANTALRAFIAHQHAPDVVAELHSLGIPAAIMQSGEQAHRLPTIMARRRPMPIDHLINGRVVHLRPPVRLSCEPAELTPLPSPMFGEHNAEVLRELGYDDAQIERLVVSRKIGDSPFGLPIGDRTHQQATRATTGTPQSE